MSRYGWIITRDLINEEAVGTTGPRWISDEISARLMRGEGISLRMYDDDGEHYYSGRYIGPDDDAMFGPLRDFGAPHAGATEIRYRTADTGRYDTLRSPVRVRWRA